jgi:hypothetical protein
MLDAKIDVEAIPASTGRLAMTRRQAVCRDVTSAELRHSALGSG